VSIVKEISFGMWCKPDLRGHDPTLGPPHERRVDPRRWTAAGCLKKRQRKRNATPSVHAESKADSDPGPQTAKGRACSNAAMREEPDRQIPAHRDYRRGPQKKRTVIEPGGKASAIR